MTVGEAEHATVVVARAGKIDPPPFVPLRHGEPGVIDAAFVLVDEHKCVGRRRGNDFGKLMPTRAVLRVGDVIHVHVHRDAAEAGDLAPVANGGTVRRTLVNLDRVVVLEKNAGADVFVSGIRVGIALDPRRRSGGPTATRTAPNGGVGWQVVVVVVDVHLPAELQLAVVVHAGNLVGLALGTAKRREQQAGENGDDRNHDQQLDQGKALSQQAAKRLFRNYFFHCCVVSRVVKIYLNRKPAPTKN